METKYKFFIIIGAIIAALLITVSVIVVLRPDKKTSSLTSDTPTVTDSPLPDGNTTDLHNIIEGIITNIDLDSSQLTISELGSGITHILTYTGGTDMRTRSLRPITVTQLNKGDIVQVTFDDNNRMSRLTGSATVWSYKNVVNAIIDTSLNRVTAGTSVYRFDSSLKVLNGDDFVPLETLKSFDSFHLYGIDNYVYLIKVATGHGYLSFVNAGDFIGGTLSYNTGKTVPVTEDLLLTLAEGEYDISVQKDDLIATAAIKISRDTTTYFDLFEYSAKPVASGNVHFSITPEGSSLYIDGVKTSYGSPVKLSFGEHSIEVSLGGYTSYYGSVSVDRTDISKQITLSEAPGTVNTVEDIIYEDTAADSADSVSAGSAFPDNTSGGPGSPSGSISEKDDNQNINEPDSTTDDGDMDSLEVIDGDSEEPFSQPADTSNTSNSTASSSSAESNSAESPYAGNHDTDGSGTTGNDHTGSDSSGSDSGSTDSGSTGNDNTDSASSGSDSGSTGSDSTVNENTGNDSSDSDSQSSNNTTPVEYHGTMTIYTTSGTSVYIDGNLAGIVEKGSLTLPKPSGTIEIGLAMEGYVSKKYTLTMDDEEEAASYKFPEMTRIS